MYKILLVDDEEIICRGLKSMIERLGNEKISEVLIAFDVKEAKQIIQTEKPDIVITDIRMPNESGLDLIQWSGMRESSPLYIVLSGYDEFNYVKHSFKMGVADYILKPISREELLAVLQKVMDRLSSNDSEKKHVQRYKQAVLENSLRRSMDNIEDAMRDAGVQFIHPCYVACAISFQYSPDTFRILNDKLSANTYELQDNSSVYVGFWYSDLYIIIANYSDETTLESIKERLSCLLQDTSDELSLHMRFAFCEPYNNVDGLSSMVKQCTSMLVELILPSGVNCHAGTSSYRLFLEELDSTLHTNNFQLACSKLELIFSDNVLSSSESLISAYDAVCSKIKAVYPLANEFRTIYLFESLSEIKTYFKRTIISFSENNNSDLEKTIIDLAIKYINENYYKNINMCIVANEVSISYNYFSKLFKEKTGSNFSEYLTEIRMAHAAQLLKDPTNRIVEVCTKVGYDNPKRFTRAFKKYYNIAPNDYRKKEVTKKR